MELNLEYLIENQPDLFYFILSCKASLGAIALLSKKFYQLIISREGRYQTFLNILEHYYSTLSYKKEIRFILINSVLIDVPLNLLAGYKHRCLVPSSLYTYSPDFTDIFVSEDIDELASMYNNGVCIRYKPANVKEIDDKFNKEEHLKKSSCTHTQIMPSCYIKRVPIDNIGNCSGCDRYYDFDNVFLKKIVKIKSGTCIKPIKMNVDNYHDIILLAGLYNGGTCMNLCFSNKMCLICQKETNWVRNHHCGAPWFDLQQHQSYNTNCLSAIPCQCRVYNYNSPSITIDCSKKYMDVL